MLLVLSIILLSLVADTEIAHALIEQIGTYGYVGAAVAGIFFVSTFTFAPASVILFHLAQEFNPVLVSVCAGAGAVVGDLLIFRFLKDRVFEELRPLFYKYGGLRLSALLATPRFEWIASVIGAVIIASPFPDEVGIALMGFSRLSSWQFASVAFMLNTLGIYAIALLARSM